jgi:hypothetical protein
MLPNSVTGMKKGFSSVFKAGLFHGTVHIVTGGGSGLGRCTAHELAHLGSTGDYSRSYVLFLFQC